MYGYMSVWNYESTNVRMHVFFDVIMPGCITIMIIKNHKAKKTIRRVGSAECAERLNNYNRAENAKNCFEEYN